MKNDSIEQQLQSLKRSPASEPDPQWSGALRTKLTWAAENPLPLASAAYGTLTGKFSLARIFALAGTALGLFIALGAGISFAALNATPNQLLYQVKIVGEDIQRVLASSNEAQAMLEIKFADRRVKELKTLTKQGSLNAQTAAKIQARYQEHVAAALSVIPTAAPDAARTLVDDISTTTQAHADAEAEFEQKFDRKESLERENLQEHIHDMLEFARESKKAAEFIKENNAARADMKLMVEHDGNGKARVKIEVKKRNKGKESFTKKEFTFPATPSTESASSTNDERKSDEEETGLKENDVDYQSETSNSANIRIEAQNGTTTIFFDDGRNRPQEREIPESLKKRFERIYSNGVQLNIQSEQSAEGSAEGGMVEQYIETSVESKSEVKINNSRKNHTDRDE